MKPFLKAFFFSLACFALVFGILYLILNWPSPDVNLPTETSTTEGKEYDRDSFTLLAHDKGNTPILLDMDFNRKEVDGHFIHYYTGKLWYGEEEESFSTQFTSNTAALEAHDFLLAYEGTLAEDLSSRTRHEVTLKTRFGELHFEADTQGDFLTKTTPDYFRFASAVDTELLKDEEVLKAHVAWENVYSSDYSISIFFDGRDKLNSETTLFTLWDEEGNFYHIDQSKVSSQHPNYKSHTWILFKDSSSKAVQKSFTAEINIGEDITINLKDWATLITLSKEGNWDKSTSGYTQGNLEKDGKTIHIEGFFKHAFY